MIKIVLANLGLGEWGQNNFKLTSNEQHDTKTADKKEFLNSLRNSDMASSMGMNWLISKCPCNGKQEETL